MEFEEVWNNVQTFLDGLPSWVSTLISVLVAFITLISVTKRNKNSKRNLKEILTEMKARLPSYREQEQAKKQEFSETQVKYRVNPKTQLLEEDGEENIQEQIQSNADCALNVVLNKFLPDKEDGEENIQEYEQVRDRVDTLMYANILAEDWKAKRGLPPTASLADVWADMRATAQKMNDKKREVKKNENEETQQTEEQEELPNDGKKNA